MKVYLNDMAHEAKENETILDFVRRVESQDAIPRCVRMTDLTILDPVVCVLWKWLAKKVV